MKKTLITVATALSPLLAFAQTDLSYFELLAVQVGRLINNFLVPLVIGLAVLVFLWGVFKAFILGGTDEGKRAEGRQLMLWGIIAFVVMVALWGIVQLATGIFGVDQGPGTLPPPGTPQVG